MKFLFAFFLSCIIGSSLYGADILGLVRILDSNDTAAFKATVLTSDDANAIRNDNNKTVLMYASWIGNSEAVEHLITKGAEINAQDTSGATALHLAIWKSHNTIALFLLAHGASPYSMSNDGMTPLDIATLRGNKEVVEAIEKAAPKLKPLL